ncbi:hypothetical protein DPMN_056832 [Dreissena polymorpha]|uniref:Uncharacterized protein n=1 Tax=Dreissena polymorpha TaxID=45954 RepID=A0A9D4CSF7_DREPO|nr:hypothetical protein DPMN_056832 [Dreissena polymorpha]
MALNTAMVTILTQVSLGSSDTVFLWIPRATPNMDGVIFVNPLDQFTYMGLVW